jgi:CRISPR/Cas system CSM-associated protein Csm2 small subunit
MPAPLHAQPLEYFINQINQMSTPQLKKFYAAINREILRRDLENLSSNDLISLHHQVRKTIQRDELDRTEVVIDQDLHQSFQDGMNLNIEDA